MEIAGKKVFDAKNRVKLAITKNDVKLGGLKDPDHCAAARALCRQTGCSEAKVYLSRIYLKMGDKWLRHTTPPALRNEIIAFDRGGQFEPGEYMISPVQPTVKLGAPKKKKYPKNGKHPQKGRRMKPHRVLNVRARGPGPTGTRA